MPRNRLRAQTTTENQNTNDNNAITMSRSCACRAAGTTVVAERAKRATTLVTAQINEVAKSVSDIVEKSGQYTSRRAEGLALHSDGTGFLVIEDDEASPAVLAALEISGV